MERRSFLKAAIGIIAPAFVPASSLWLPPERPRVIVPLEEEPGVWVCVAIDDINRTITYERRQGDSGQPDGLLVSTPDADHWLSALGSRSASEGFLVKLKEEMDAICGRTPRALPAECDWKASEVGIAAMSASVRCLGGHPDWPPSRPLLSGRGYVRRRRLPS